MLNRFRVEGDRGAERFGCEVRPCLWRVLLSGADEHQAAAIQHETDGLPVGRPEFLGIENNRGIEADQTRLGGVDGVDRAETAEGRSAQAIQSAGP